MSQEFEFLMIGAMYENGGNTSHRFLDGHPEMYVYPFESQIGTRLVQDPLSSMFPVKYRWPVFALEATPEEDYHAIIDEEGKVRSRTPHVSKFRDYPFDLSDNERRRFFVDQIKRSGRSRANNVAAFFKATFEAWKDYKESGKNRVYVGYSPIITVDADKILTEMPQAHFLHIVRNPWSAYADTKKRPVPLSLKNYMTAWALNQHFALLFKEQFPKRFHLVRTEDVLSNPRTALGTVCKAMGLEATETLSSSSWNGMTLKEVYPWGTIRIPSPEANLATAKELSPEEVEDIRARTWQYMDVLDYRNFLKK